MTVTVCELPGSPTGSYQNGSYELKRMVRVAWDDRFTYAEELLPITTIGGSNNQNVPGAPFPGRPEFRVAGFSFSPFMGENEPTSAEDSYGVMSYEFAKFEVSYSVPKNGSAGDPNEAQELDGDPVQLLEHSFESGGEFLTLTSTKLFWRTGANTTVSEEAKPGIIVPTIQHTITWPRVVGPNWNALTFLAGSVNNATFRLRAFDYPAETLLYLGYSGSQEVMSDGERAWKLTLKFSARGIIDSARLVPGEEIAGWNHTFNQSVGWWDKINLNTEGSGTNPYPRANFDLLFQTPETP